MYIPINSLLAGIAVGVLIGGIVIAAILIKSAFKKHGKK